MLPAWPATGGVDAIKIIVNSKDAVALRRKFRFFKVPNIILQ